MQIRAGNNFPEKFGQNSLSSLKSKAYLNAASSRQFEFPFIGGKFRFHAQVMARDRLGLHCVHSHKNFVHSNG
jgi:hypothetical protein